GLGEGLRWLRLIDASNLPIFVRIHVSSTATFLDRFRDRLPATDADTLRRAAELTATWGSHTASRFSLIHGDYRLDNLMFDGDTEVVAVDWQTLEIGFPARDLAYFLSTALPPEVRRAHEVSLVAAYHEQLVAHGVTDYPGDECFEDYRRGMLQGPLITVIGCVNASTPPTEDSDGMFLSMVANSCAAIRDLGTLDLLAV
nr:phosphotransferase [Micromonospora sp. DSM 115978]